MHDEQAASLFAGFLARREADANCSFTEFCNQHPQHGPMLRALFEDYLLIERARQNAATLIEMSPGTLSTVQIHGRDSTEAWQVLLDRLNGRSASHHRYRIEGERIGRGGMGEVFRAIDLDTLRVVALKRIRQDLITSESDPDYKRLRARFLEEAQIQAQLDHPGIAPLHDMGVDSNGRVFFTMKFVKGDSFKAFLRESALELPNRSLARSVTILREVCETVAFAHSKGVIHRDLKPENIMLGAFGETYVMDWGLAKILNTIKSGRDEVPIDSNVRTSASVVNHVLARATLTGQDQKVGTPYFMSPEQATGDQGRIGLPTDIYAAGAILYTALAGEPPYHDSSTPKTAFEVIDEVRLGPPRPISRVAPGAPPELAAICEKSMARKPEDRYPSMLALANDLRAYLEDRVVLAHTGGTWNQIRKWVSRNRLKVAMCFAATIAFFGTAFWLFELQNRQALELEQVRTERALKDQILAKDRADLASERALDAEQLAREEAAEAERQRLLAESKSEEAERARSAAELAGIREREEREKAESAAESARSEKLRAESALSEQQVLRESAENAKKEVELVNQKLADQELEIASLLISARRYQTEDLVRVADTMWPPKIRLIDEYKSWLEQAETIQRDRTFVESRIQRLSDEDRIEAKALVDLLSQLSQHEIYASTQFSMNQRLNRAQDLARAQETHASDWKSVLASLENADDFPIYNGLRIAAQDELVPVSTKPNPLTGCFEFYCPFTGVRPTRNADGSYESKSGSAAVFVLIPSGNCIVGVQNRFPEQRNYFANARPIELPKELRPARVEAFFVSRTLLTRSQFSLMTGVDRDFDWHADDHNSVLTNISWDSASSYLQAWGMNLPSELQWEYLSRSASPSISEVWKNSLTAVDENWQKRTERAWGITDMASGTSEWVVASHDRYFGTGYLGFRIAVENVDPGTPLLDSTSVFDLIEQPTEYFAELELSDAGQITLPDRFASQSAASDSVVMARYRSTSFLAGRVNSVATIPQVCRGGAAETRSSAEIGLRDFRAGSAEFDDCGVRMIIQPERIP